MRQGERASAQSNMLLPYVPVRPSHPAKDTAADVGDLWRIIVRRRGIVLFTTALFVLGALLYSLLAAPLFSATSQLLIDPRNRQVVSRDLNDSAVAPDGGVTVVESQVKVIESDSVLLRAIAETGLEDDPEFGAPSRGLIQETLQDLKTALLGHHEIERNRRTLALLKLRRKLAVKRADKVFVVDVIVTASDPDKAARIVNAIAKAYLADQAEARSNAANRASGELRGRLDSLRTDVNAAETRLEAFKAANGLIASSGRLVSEQQLTDSNARLIAARNRIAEAKSKLQDLQGVRGAAVDTSALPEAIQSPTIERLRSQYSELASKEGDLRTQMGARHPYMAAIRTQMSDVKRLIDTELGRITKAAEIEVQRAQAAEKLLKANLNELRTESVQTSKATVQLRELESSVQASRSIYDTYLVRSREIAEQANIDTANTRVITWAQPPEERSWPLRGLILSAGLMAGLGIGVGLAMVREYAKPALLSRRQCERLLGAPVLATFPPSLGLRDPSCQKEAIVALDTLRSRFRPPKGTERALVVVVAASAGDAGEQRSLIDVLSGTAVARGDRVLIVEADLNGEDLGKGGLLEVLRGEMSLYAAITADAATGARWLGIGNGDKPVDGAFDRANVEQFLDHVGGRFDLVLINGGILATNTRIASVVGAADRLLVVAQAGRTLQADLTDLDRVASAMGRSAFGALLVDDRVRSR
ncbi:MULTISPECIES: GumC family protein [Methylobacterium]|nr:MULTISPECIES: exopolysaccharide transport family protein [Methylobacterium]